MELHDCAFPTLQEVVATTDYATAFKDLDYAFMVGSKPRGPGMERGDLLKDNGAIFVDVGKAMSDHAKRDCKTIVVGNPANTNAMILGNHAKGIPLENFTAMTRLDHNRALTQLALKTGKSVTDIKNLAVWGNHSPTMYPDLRNATVGGVAALDLVDDAWLKEDFIPTVQQRGGAIIQARGQSSAASAGNAALDHMRDWALGSDEWQSISLQKDDNKYGIPEGIMFSYPCTTKNGKWEIVEGLSLDDEFTQ